MHKHKRRPARSCRRSNDLSCCRVDGIVSIDARGQIVLPKEVRERAGIEAGDKLAVITYESAGEICCISLVKTSEFADLVKNMLGPMMKDIIGEQG